MANLKLWDFVKEVKGTGYKWVDLTHELSPETPHWYGFKPLEGKLLFDYREGTPDDMMGAHEMYPVQRSQPVWNSRRRTPSFLGRWPRHEQDYRKRAGISSGSGR